MCGFGVLVTSFARNEREAFAASLIVGLVLALLGGNLSPPGALARVPSGPEPGHPESGGSWWGSGVCPSCGDPTSASSGPFVVLCLIAVVTIGSAMTRVRGW